MDKEKISVVKQENRIESIMDSVSKILGDYKKTAETLDKLTNEVDGINPTNHSGNVDKLERELLEALDTDEIGIKPVWVRKGYESKQAWLDAQE